MNEGTARVEDTRLSTRATVHACMSLPHAGIPTSALHLRRGHARAGRCAARGLRARHRPCDSKTRRQFRAQDPSQDRARRADGCIVASPLPVHAPGPTGPRLTRTAPPGCAVAAALNRHAGGWAEQLQDAAPSKIASQSPPACTDRQWSAVLIDGRAVSNSVVSDLRARSHQLHPCTHALLHVGVSCEARTASVCALACP